MKIIPKKQLDRIEALEKQLSEIEQIHWERLKVRPSQKSWCVLEVLKHVSVAQGVYVDKVENSFKKKIDLSGRTEFECSGIPAFLIKRFPPQQGKIKLKMKTTKIFEPQLAVEALNPELTNNVLQEYRKGLVQLKGWIKKYSEDGCSKKKFNSAIGETCSASRKYLVCH